MTEPRKTIQDIKLPKRKESTSRTAASVPAVKKGRVSAKKTSIKKIEKKEESIARPSRRIVAERARVRVIERTPVVESGSQRPQTGKKKRWFWLAIVAMIVFLGCAAYGALFHKATLNVTPRQSVAPQSTVSVTLAADPAQTEVPLVVMSLSDTVEETIRATGSEQVSERASGTIIVYNNFSTTPQKLVEETRFETPDGKIYKTAKGNPITIPGITAGKPGQIEVKVYAAEPGVEYNHEPTDFVVPGFRGGPKFEKIYARSVGAISGGFVGMRSTIAQDEKERIVKKLSQQLGDRLKAEAFLQKTDEFIILDQSSRVAIGEASIVPSESNPLQAKLSVAGTYSSILINKGELASNMAAQLLPGYKGEPVRIQNIDQLTLSVQLTEDAILQNLERITLLVTGAPYFVFEVPEEALKGDLLGIQRKAVPELLHRYTSVESARLIIRPFWKKTAPEELKSIIIRYNLD